MGLIRTINPEFYQPKDLILWLKFDEKSSGAMTQPLDSSGNNHVISVDSGSPTYGTGNIGKGCFNCDGILKTNINNLPLTDISFCLWALTTSSDNSSNQRMLGYENVGSSYDGLGIYFAGTQKPTLIMRNSGNNYDQLFGTVSSNIFNFYGVSISSINGTSIYLNNNLINTNIYAKAYSYSPGVYLRINSAGIGSTMLIGKMDDFRIYNRALSQNEMFRLYNST